MTGRPLGGLRWLKRQRIEKASRDESIRRIEQLIDRRERKIGEAFMESIRRIRDLAALEEIANILETGASLESLYSTESLRNEFATLRTAITASAVEGARLTAELQSQDRVVGPRGRVVNFTFNATNPRVSSFAEEVAARRVREVSEDVRGVIREVVRRETVAGTNPREAARTIRQSIGLTAKQEQAVRNYRQALEDRNPSVLRRELRDRRFDPTVIRAIENDTPLSPEQIDRMTERYRERFVKYRSEVIGRTEATRTVNGASREYLQSAVDDGLIAEEQIRRFWHYTLDDRTRAEHRQIPAMNADGVGQNESFDTPLGPLRYPGDPAGSAANTVQCRCVVFPKVVSMELVQEQG